MMTGSDATQSAPQWLVRGEGFVSLHVVARPGCARPGVLRRDPRGLLIALGSQPSKGRANEELIALLADLLGTPRSSVTIVRGHTTRVKTVRIADPQPFRVAELLSAYP
jgi:uncharacterized protein YggU (UPF0235/DUF167 family)